MKLVFVTRLMDSIRKLSESGWGLSVSEGLPGFLSESGGFYP